MKSIFKLILIIFTLALTLLSEPSSLQTHAINNTNYIQNIKNETVVLVSNNILCGEITSYQEENSSNLLGSSPVVLSFTSNRNLLNNNKAQLNGCFIHNLSTNKQKVHQIRAP